MICYYFSRLQFACPPTEKNLITTAAIDLLAGLVYNHGKEDKYNDIKEEKNVHCR